MRVTLLEGPFHGTEVEVEFGQTLVCEGVPVLDGMVARYRPTRVRADRTYRFREYDRIVGRIPLPTLTTLGSEGLMT